MNIRLSPWALALFATLTSVPSYAAYTIQSAAVDTPDTSLTRTTYELQEGTDPLNQFRVTRVKATWGHKPFILHAPFGYDVDWYQISPNSEYQKSLLGSLARLGFDVWVIDDRLSRQPPGSCEQSGCLAMSNWTIQTRVNDSRFVRQLIHDHYPVNVPLVIGGFSGGAAYAQAVVNEHPNDYVGLFLWNGTLLGDATQQAYTQNTCDFLTVLVSLGVVFDPSPQLLAAMYQLLSLDPDGLSPFAGSGDPALQFLDDKLMEMNITQATNREVFYVVHTEHLENPNWPTPDFFFLQGDTTQGFTVADTAQVMQLGNLIDSYGSVTTLRDIQCALAGETTYTANVSAFTGSVLAMGTGGGLGSLLPHTLSLYTNADVQEPSIVSAYGEVDRYFHPQRNLLVDIPFAQWAWPLYDN